MRLPWPLAPTLVLLFLLVSGLPIRTLSRHLPQTSSQQQRSSAASPPTSLAKCKPANVRLRTQQAPMVFSAKVTTMSGDHEGGRAGDSAVVRMQVIKVHKGGTLRVVPDSDILLIGIPSHVTASCRLEVGKKYYVFGESAGNSTVRALGVPVSNRTRNSKKGIRKGTKNCKRCATVKHLNGTSSVQFDFQMELTCTVMGKPMPEITWYKDGRKVKYNSRVQIQVLKNKKRGRALAGFSEVLRIDQMQWKDAGEYECRANSTASNSTASKTFYVNVTKSPHEAKPCENLLRDFCLNGGICTYLSGIAEPYCQCAEGYKGQRCEIKDPSPSNVRAESWGIDVSTRTLSLYWGK